MMQHIKYLVVLIGRRRCILHVRAHISVAVSRRQEAMFVLAEGGTGKSCWASIVFTQNIDTSGTAKANVFKHGKSSIVLSKKAPFLKLKISL